MLCLAVAFGVAVKLFLGHTGDVRITTGFEWMTLAWGEQPGQRLEANFSLYLDSLTILWMLFVTGLATLIALYAERASRRTAKALTATLRPRRPTPTKRSG